MMSKINYSWEVISQYKFINEHSDKQKAHHVIAPNAIAACEKVNKILERGHIEATNTRSAKTLPLIFSVERQDKIDT
jgi:hypothetical protein